MRRRGVATAVGALVLVTVLGQAPPPALSQDAPVPSPATTVTPPTPPWLEPEPESHLEAAGEPTWTDELLPPGHEGAEARTVTVTPSTDLVHGQEVTIRGTGWPARDEVVGLLCTDSLDIGDCELLDFGRTGAGGNFRIIAPVDVVIDGYDEVTDCRISSCQVGAAAQHARSPVGVTVTFDPAGPDPARHELLVTPHTDLADGDEVEAEGSGYPPIEDDFGVVVLMLCRMPVDSLEDCDVDQAQEFELEGTTSFRETVQVSPILRLPEGEKDCRFGSCAMIAAPLDFDSPTGVELSEAGLVELGFDPTAPLRPPPTLVAVPSTDLLDGDVVQLTGSGFDADEFVFALQCVAGSTDFDDCNLEAPFFGQTDGTGGFEGAFPVQAIFNTFSAGTVDCRVDACAVAVIAESSDRRGEAALGFDPDGPLLDPTLTVTPSTGLEDGDRVTVVGAGWPGLSFLEVIQCPVDRSGALRCDFDNAWYVEPGGGGQQPASVPLPATVEAAEAATSFTLSYQVHATFGGRRGQAEVDCQVLPCELRARVFGRPDLNRSAALEFLPPVPGPITATPTFTG